MLNQDSYVLLISSTTVCFPSTTTSRYMYVFVFVNYLYYIVRICAGTIQWGLSRRKWSPTTTGPPGPSTANGACCCRWSPGPTIASMDGPLCRKWSPYRKPAYGGYKSWLHHGNTIWQQQHAWAFVAIAGREWMIWAATPPVWCCHKRCHTLVAVTMLVSLLFMLWMVVHG